MLHSYTHYYKKWWSMYLVLSKTITLSLIKPFTFVIYSYINIFSSNHVYFHIYFYFKWKYTKISVLLVVEPHRSGTFKWLIFFRPYFPLMKKKIVVVQNPPLKRNTYFFVCRPLPREIMIMETVKILSTGSILLVLTILKCVFRARWTIL